MTFRRASSDKRNQYFERIDRLNNLKKRKHRLYNRLYRRSPIFVATTALRICFFLFFAWIYFYKGGSGKIIREKVLSKSNDIYLSAPRMNVDKLCFETNGGEYEAHFIWTGMPLINPGDTLLIEHNILGKPTYFGPLEGDRKYELALNWIFYLIVGMVTVVSFAFNDGLDPFTDKILWVVWTLNLAAFTHYFMN